MRRTARRRLIATSAAFVCMSLVAASCGGDDDGSETTTAAADTTTAAAETTAATADETTAAPTTEGAASTDAPATTESGGTETTAAGDEAAYDDAEAALVTLAEEEGKVTVYSSQGLDPLNALGAAFEAKYPGIDVEIVRQVDGDSIPKLETEISTGTAGADLAVLAAPAWVQQQGDAGNFVDPTAAPELAGLGPYDAAEYVHEGNYFEVGAAVLTMAWNTDLVPEGLTKYEDLLDPKFGDGKLGAVDITIGPAVTDFYRWMDETFGEEYLPQLAELAPRLYPSALPVGEALSSGEIYATIYAAPSQLIAAKANGAPVDFAIDDRGAWGARFFGVIPKSGAHPNAAALFANFMVTDEGQEIISAGAGTVLPDVESALITQDKVRTMDLAGMQPDAVQEYNAKWEELFR